MTIQISLVVLAVIGLLVYVLASNGKAAEIGRICFFCALLVLCFGFAPQGALRITGR